MVPEGEWEEFLAAMRRNLPLCVRIRRAHPLFALARAELRSLEAAPHSSHAGKQLAHPFHLGLGVLGHAQGWILRVLRRGEYIMVIGSAAILLAPNPNDVVWVGTSYSGRPSADGGGARSGAHGKGAALAEIAAVGGSGVGVDVGEAWRAGRSTQQRVEGVRCQSRGVLECTTGFRSDSLEHCTERVLVHAISATLGSRTCGRGSCDGWSTACCIVRRR